MNYARNISILRYCNYDVFYELNPPHFHVTSGDYKAIINIKDEIITSFMPKRALLLIFEWLEIHRFELLANWDKCQNGISPEKIEPLNKKIWN